jgi:uncharacterized membrane protein YfcA
LPEIEWMRGPVSIVTIFIAYIVLGLISGIISGLLGIGGGIITTPCLFFLFSALGYPSADLMRLTIGTSLAAMVFNTLSATWAHHQKANVDWELVKKVSPGLMTGSILGAFLASHLSSEFLKIFFGIVVCLLSVSFFKEPSHRFCFKLPIPRFIFLSISILIGTLANILGIGGGSLTVPFLFSLHLNARQVVGTSAATTALVATLGAVTYMILGWDKNIFPENIGYINLPAFLIISLTTFFSVPIGVHFSYQIDQIKIRKIFAAMLLVSGTSLIIANVF